MPDPQVIEQAIEPKTKADQEKLGIALQKMAAEDPSFTVFTDQESGQTILKGLSERHLDDKINILRRTYKVDANIGPPQVAYRETLGRSAVIDACHKRQTGGRGQFARVQIAFAPGPPNSGFQFQSIVQDGAIPDAFIPSVRQGIESVAGNGLVAGFPLIDFRATLIGGAFHDVDSSNLSFEIAGRVAFKELREKAAPKLLEPVMMVEVAPFPWRFDPVIDDLRRRNGRILDVVTRGEILAMVPAANLFGYDNATHDLGITHWAAMFSHYQPIGQPGDDPDDVFPQAIGMRA